MTSLGLNKDLLCISELTPLPLNLWIFELSLLDLLNVPLYISELSLPDILYIRLVLLIAPICISDIALLVFLCSPKLALPLGVYELMLLPSTNCISELLLLLLIAPLWISEEILFLCVLELPLLALLLLTLALLEMTL